MDVDDVAPRTRSQRSGRGEICMYRRQHYPVALVAHRRAFHLLERRLLILRRHHGRWKYGI